jgi:hypothetical protein
MAGQSGLGNSENGLWVAVLAARQPTTTYVRATLTEVAAALAALTGEPHPLAEPETGQQGSAG